MILSLLSCIVPLNSDVPRHLLGGRGGVLAN